MRLLARKFMAEDGGAVTVDWVVLTAAVAGLGLAAVSIMRVGIDGGTTGLVTALGTLGTVFAY